MSLLQKKFLDRFGMKVAQKHNGSFTGFGLNFFIIAIFKLEKNEFGMISCEVLIFLNVIETEQ